MESKYNLLTRLLKNIKNVITPDGGIAGGGGGVMIVHEVEQRGETFLEGTLPNVDGYAFRNSVDKSNPQNYYYVDISVDLDDIDIESISVSIGNNIYPGFGSALTYANGTLTVNVGSSILGRTSGYTSESELQGLNITVYALSIVLDKTYKEIADAGFAVLHLGDKGTSIEPLVLFDLSEENGAMVVFGRYSYIAETENDYPVLRDTPVPEIIDNGESFPAQ